MLSSFAILLVLVLLLFFFGCFARERCRLWRLASTQPDGEMSRQRACYDLHRCAHNILVRIARSPQQPLHTVSFVTLKSANRKVHVILRNSDSAAKFRGGDKRNARNTRKNFVCPPKRNVLREVQSQMKQSLVESVTCRRSRARLLLWR